MSLKKKHVLLNDWLIEEFERIANEKDISFSEAVRIVMCCLIGREAEKRNRHFHFPYKACAMTDPKTLKDLDRFYFETRAATKVKAD